MERQSVRLMAERVRLTSDSLAVTLHAMSYHRVQCTARMQAPLYARCRSGFMQFALTYLVYSSA